jgi:hypothetical protein
MQYAGGDARVQAAVLLAVGRAFGRAADRNVVTIAYACEGVAGRASESNIAADFVGWARPALIKHLGALPAAEHASRRVRAPHNDVAIILLSRAGPAGAVGRILGARCLQLGSRSAR